MAPRPDGQDQSTLAPGRTLRWVEGNTSLSATPSAAQRITLVAADTTMRAPNPNDRDWVLNALCRSKDPDQLFVCGAQQRKAVAICRHCPVMQECAADALDNKVEYGIWGGLTERQRRALLKQHPDVESWADFLDKRHIRSVG